MYSQIKIEAVTNKHEELLVWYLTIGYAYKCFFHLLAWFF